MNVKQFRHFFLWNLIIHNSLIELDRFNVSKRKYLLSCRCVLYSLLTKNKGRIVCNISTIKTDFSPLWMPMSALSAMCCDSRFAFCCLQTGWRKRAEGKWHCVMKTLQFNYLYILAALSTRSLSPPITNHSKGKY